MKRAFLCTLLIMVFASLSMAATTFTVSNTNDAGSGSLRQALTDANGASGATAASPFIIDATGISGTISLQSVLPAIANHITINGPGASSLTITRGVSTAFRIFFVNSGFTVAIDGVTITNGSNSSGGGIFNTGTLTVTNCTVSSNSGDDIYNSGILTVTGSTISGNTGGIYNSGTLTVTGSTISDNTDWYGGIYNEGTVTVTGSTLSNNTAWDFGGGGILNFGTATVTNSTLSDNDGVCGGGICNWSSLTLINSTIANNTAAIGGGIFSFFGNVTVASSTISGNYASGNGSVGNVSGGGGIFNYYGSTVLLFNTIIFGNSSNNAPDIFGDAWNAGYAGLISQGHNLIGNTSGNSGWISSDLQDINPLLNSLASNGGPTQTMALQSSSPAIDAGSDDVLDDPYNLTTDQRGTGHDRSFGSHVDIGAYESALSLTTISLSGGTSYCTGSDVTISWVSSEVTSVDIDFSTDNGTNWTSIATGQTSGTTGGSYDWTIPNSPGSNRRVRVSSAANSSITAMSNAFSINVPPTVTIDPESNDPVCPGTSVTFSAAASGTTTVQWQISTDGGTTFDDIDGETSTSLVISSPALAMDGYQYQAVFTNACSATVTTATATLSVDEDNSAPVPDIETLPDVTGECSVTISTAPTATDNCAGIIIGTTTDPLIYTGEGTYTVHWTYDDDNGNTSTQNQRVVVDDVTPPTFSVSTSPTSLWPPNSEMQTITISASASDNCGSATWVISSISGNDGATSSDWNYSANTSPGSVQLRAYRTGSGTGRTYTLNFSASDGHGNSTPATCYVYVPHSQNKVITSQSHAAIERGFMSDVLPNPFTASTNIRFTLPGDGMTTIRIYDRRGEEIAVLLHDALRGGVYDVIWDGLTAGGGQAAAGEYFYRIEWQGMSETGLIVLAR